MGSARVTGASGRVITWKSLAIANGVLLLVACALLARDRLRAWQARDGLLSPRVYAGILPERNRLLYNFGPLEAEVRALVAARRPAVVAVSVHNLRDGASFGVDEHMAFEPASLNKIPMAMLALRMVERGQFTLDTPLQVQAADLDDGGADLRRTAGERVPLRDLLTDMLAVSDNTPFRMLHRLVDQREWAHLAHHIDFYELDGAGSRRQADLQLSTTAEANFRIFSALYLSSKLSAAHSEFILSSLLGSTLDLHDLARIPRTVRIAHKFAEYQGREERYFHDCGIMYVDDSRFFYAVMTRGLDSAAGRRTTGDILHAVHAYVDAFLHPAPAGGRP